MVTRIHRPRVKIDDPTPKEKGQWKLFEELAGTMAGDGPPPPMVLRELDRLCELANPLALRFRERINLETMSLRAADEHGLEPPARREKSGGAVWGTKPLSDRDGVGFAPEKPVAEKSKNRGRR